VDSCASHRGVKDRVGEVVGEVFASGVEPDDDVRMTVMVVTGRKMTRENWGKEHRVFGHSTPHIRAREG
jgi:hypothetical protein